MQQIVSDRLILKPVALQDAPFILELQNMPKWLKYIGDRNLKTVADTELYIKAKMIEHYKEHGYGNYVICHKEEGHKMGTCGLFNRPGLEGVDIGFALLPQFEGKGYGYESSVAIMEFARNSLKLKKLSAIVLPENQASVRLIEKLGLKFIKKVQLPDDPEQLDYYEILLNK